MGIGQGTVERYDQTDENGRASADKPHVAEATAKIAVKVINHYGDEVLEVFPV